MPQQILIVIIWMLAGMVSVVASRLILAVPDEKELEQSASVEMNQAMAGAQVLCLVCAWRVSTQGLGFIPCVELASTHVALIIAALIDGRYRIIPNAIPLFLLVIKMAIIAGLMATGAMQAYELAGPVFALAACLLVFLLARVLSRQGVGMGDVKLVCTMAFMLNLYAIVYTLTLSFLLFFVVAVYLLVRKKRTTKDSLPFAPFLLAGYSLALILSLY